jgi:putative hydrolase of the HAD superfamily
VSENTIFDIIAFDADDTLWHNMPLYIEAQKKLARLLSDYIKPDELDNRLYTTEMHNVPFFGYGINSFTLSMIETAVKISNEKLPGETILEILDLAREMLRAPVQLIDHVPEVLAQVSQNYKLMIITKGDILDQCGKVERSGLAGYFSVIEVVHEKRPETYKRIIKNHRIDAGRFLMVGNSLKSDVLPVLAVGGAAVHIPHEITWAYESVSLESSDDSKHVELEHIGLLPDWLEKEARSV